MQGVHGVILDALTTTGNPSSPHAEGRASRQWIEQARRIVAKVLSAAALDVVFCSGGTEANHLGLLGLARAVSEERRQILIPSTVHPSLWAAGQALQDRGFSLKSLPVDPAGRIDIARASELLANQRTAAVAFSLVNHELGTVVDYEAVVKLAHDAGALVFCDAVQALGRMPLSVATIGADAISVSAHKIGGPKGVGALWIRPGIDLLPIIGGGKQESGRRPGTQATALIAGFGAAASAVQEGLGDSDRQRRICAYLAEEIAGLGGRLLSSDKEGVCNTICVHFPGIPGDLLVSSFDLVGIAISTGAACSSGTNLPSTVLMAVGLGEDEALECIRVSVGRGTTQADAERFVGELPVILARAKQFS
ncbi:MAG: cysteine desulfurase [Kofleriaceae bacterium]|nr:cysteine desulfurase [Kofleriaceae bacterium]